MESIARSQIMDENEEFEFRNRAEQEAANSAAQNTAPAHPNISGTKFPLKIGSAGFPDALKSTLSDVGWANRNIAGMGSAVVNAWEGLKGVIPGVQTNPDQVANQKII